MEATTETKPAGVYAAIAAVSKELAAEGISKSRQNQQQGYKFRGIDEVLNALAPLLSKHGLCVLPRCLDRECIERQTKNGGALFSVVCRVEFDFVCAEDGSKHTVGPMFGEAMDSADKATNKAMSAAYKYAAIQAFCIPTEGDNDADATTHEIAPSRPSKGSRPRDEAPYRNDAPPLDPPTGVNPDRKAEARQPPSDPPAEAPPAKLSSKEITARAAKSIAEATDFKKLADLEDKLDLRHQERSLNAHDYDTLLVLLLERRCQIAAFPDEFNLAESQIASFRKRNRIDDATAEVLGSALADKRARHAAAGDEPL